MDGLGVHILTGEALLDLLRQAARTGEPEWVYAEMYASAIHVSDNEGEDDGDT